jgi:N-acetylglucosaminyldiphosphoundecaprenol N-acetyl-beta-D-mannosaminyltransferase
MRQLSPTSETSHGPAALRLCGLDLCYLTPTDAADALMAWAKEAQATGMGRHVHLVNAYTIAVAGKDPSLAAALQADGINLVDGTPIAWTARAWGLLPAGSQASRGPTLFLDTVDRGRDTGVKHFLLGGSPQTLSNLERQLRACYPGVDICGSYSPPFRTLTHQEERDLTVRISGSHPDLVWVGLGTPKQDFEAKRLAEGLPVVAVAVGAAFDFAAGTKREAPGWLRGSGMEWLFRLACEPRRLWRRYLFGNVRFMFAVLRDHHTAAQPPPRVPLPRRASLGGSGSGEKASGSPDGPT